MKPGRNEPCPCGSGLKFKRCCGAAPTARQDAAPRAVNPEPRARSCGPCTACCDGWLKINIHGHDVYPGNPCPYSTGHSCRIYADRPEDPCRRFVCGWLEPGSPLPEEFRPDRIGVIFMSGRWRGIPMYGLVPAGHDPEDGLIEWMKDYAARTRRPFVFVRDGQWYAHGSPEFQREVIAKLARGEKLWP